MATTLASPRHHAPGHGRRARRRTRRAAALLVVAGSALTLLPVVLLAGAGNPPCTSAPADAVTPTGPIRAGMFAAPLRLAPGRWYRVGATRYDGTVGASGAFLPSAPDSFAELSLLEANPYPNFTFADANALSNLPYGTALRVANGTHQQVLVKRDIGYGQGPGQTIPYRIDIYDPAAAQLDVSKSTVQVELAPSSGTAATLDQLPAPAAPTTNSTGCAADTAGGPLTLTPGQQAQIAPDGTASAPQAAPVAVKLAIAAANQIHTLPYSLPAGAAPVHYGPLTSLWPAYDCSGAVSYVLYKAGLHSAMPDVSGSLEQWGLPGPGRWITVYANSRHTFVDIAGRAFDTSNYGGPDLPAGPGPRWRQNPTGNLADGLSYVARHPEGL
jgi:hypothetical protein